MASHRSRSRSPDSSNKRIKYARDDDRRHHEYKYEDEDYSRSRHRDDRDRERDRDRDHRLPQLYRVDDRDRRREDSRDRHRDSDRDRRRDDDRSSRYRHDDRDRRDDRRQHRRHYEDDERHKERERDTERDKEDRNRDGRRANGAPSSPRHSADNRSRSPHRSSPAGRMASPSDVSTSSNSANISLQKSQMTDIQRARLEKMELWKKRKAAEAAAKSGKTSTNETTTNISSPTVGTPVTSSKGTHPLETALNVCVETNDSKLPVFGFTRANAKTSENQAELEFDDEDSQRRKLEMLPTLTAEDKARINAAPAEDEVEDQDLKLEDDDEEARKHIKREKTEEIKMEIDEGDRLPNRSVQPVVESMQIDDEDPLDAFMHDVDREARQIDEADMANFGSKTATNTRVLMGEDDDDGVALNSDGELPELHYAKEAKKSKSKEVAVVDHSKIKYEPFTKDFYIPPPEYRDLTREEIADLRLELNGITIRGKDAPVPVTKWSQCGLNATILDVITRLDYEKPTPIQSQAIPAVMSGRDVIGVAQTGSGKTIAFLLPMFRHILNQRPLEKMEGPIALILSPTRELATQIFKDCKPFLKVLGLRASCVYGGPPIKEHIAQLKSGAEIVVCTPGRMIDLLSANSGRVVNLQRVTYIVLDEADRQFDLGFEPQVMKIISNVRPDRQTVLFSATFPKQMEALARKILKRPIEITVGTKSVVAPEIDQVVEVIKEEDKFARLLGLLGDLYTEADSEDHRVLIFVDRQEGADFLLDRLMKRGYPCQSLHGGKDQIDRDQVIKDFKDGAVQILTATSVAARGLDVKQLKLVVNYDCPNHMEDYVHRVGRTGRAGQHGKAVTFITPDQGKYARDIVKALTLSGTAVPKELEELGAEWQKLIDAGRAYAVGSGFGGKGLDRFDQDRAAQKRLQRREHGDEDDQEEKVEDVFDEDGERKAIVATASGSSESKPNGIQNQAVADAVAKVHQGLHSKGQLRVGVPVDPKLPDSGENVQRLEINDLPQKARWAVTNRTNIAKVLEQTGASITTKGTFFQNGRLPGPGESKLHLLVEGETPVQVENAMRELRRLLSEASDAALTSASREAPTGRYNVMGS
jgi:ATP-dependent RNA helicase DDX46/PRP5